jgi:DNA-directed RNA polymerase specialized sigma24 family protein
VSTDDDFTAYVGTHWSMLVRSALLLGCATDLAEGVVQSALVRSYRRWARVWRDDRADVDVLANLLDAVYAPAGRTWRGERADRDAGHPDGPVDNDPAGDPSGEAEDPPTELARALLPLSALHRDVLVLRYVSELTETQAAEVLAVHPDTMRERLQRALAAIEPVRLREDLP